MFGVLQMTLEDEEKDAIAGWRPVLVYRWCLACFGVIIPTSLALPASSRDNVHLHFVVSNSYLLNIS